MFDMIKGQMLVNNAHNHDLNINKFHNTALWSPSRQHINNKNVLFQPAVIPKCKRILIMLVYLLLSITGIRFSLRQIVNVLHSYYILITMNLYK
jgi:hypothetical protein